MTEEQSRRRLNRKVDRRGGGVESPAAEAESKPTLSSSSPKRAERSAESSSPVRFSADAKNDQENANNNNNNNSIDIAKGVDESKPLSASSTLDDTVGSEGRSRLRRSRDTSNATATDVADSSEPAPSSAPVVPPPKPTRNVFRPTNPPPRNDKLIKKEHVATFPYSLFNRTLPIGLGYRMGNFMSTRSSMNSRGLYNKEATNGWGLGINISDILPCGELMSLVRPFVRVHAVNINSGMYIKGTRKGITRSVSTKSLLLKDSNSFPRWDQQLLLDADFSDIVTEECLLLFELLDEKPSLKVVTGGKSRASKRIAWGFLLPLSNNGKNVNVGLKNEWIQNGGTRQRSPRGGVEGDQQMSSQDDSPVDTTQSSSLSTGDFKVRIQLYASADDNSLVGYMQRQAMGWRPYSSSSAWSRDDPAYPDDVCEAYIQWRRQHRQKLTGGCLCVALGPRYLDQSRGMAGDAAVEGPALSSPLRQMSMTGMGSASDSVSAHQSKAAARVRSAILKRSRAPREPCVVPDKLLRRIDAGPEGAMVVKFSNSGHLLAIASRTATVSPPFVDVNSPTLSVSYIYGLRLYDTDADIEVWSDLGAHHSTIYDMQWSENDSYIVTSAGDGTCKVWNVRCLLDRLVDKPMTQAAECRDVPYLLHTLECHPPVFVYSVIFQEYGRTVNPFGITTTNVTNTNLSKSFDVSGTLPADVPRVICGASDGKIRVFDSGLLTGKISSSNPEGETPPHSGRVNALCIDKRSKYLLSGSSDGDILVWRLDRNGWYCPLRKFKRDGPANGMIRNASTSTLLGGVGIDSSAGVMSLTTHPDKARGQLLALSQPFNLRMYNLNTYKIQSACPAMSHAKQQHPSFCRAGLSADGSFAYCQIAGAEEESKDGFSLQFWHSQTGAQASSPLSKIVFPFPVRSVSWHPAQHCIAVSMVGAGSSVLVYSGDREGAERAIIRQGMLDAHMVMGESMGEGGSSIVDVNQSVYTEGKSLYYPGSGLGDTSSVVEGLRMYK